MGVTGLWRLIEPAGKPVPVETLENKVLAVDISIWLHQMVKGYQDAKGAPLPNAHLMGLFQRLCKLLYFRIKPVFVFDGGFPELKRETIAKRQDNKAKYHSESERLKRELVLLLSKKTAVSSLLGKQISPTKRGNVDDTREEDMFKLPALPEKDVESESESDEESSGSITDLHSVDVESDAFKNMPIKEKYELLVELKETRKMNSWGKLHELPKKSDNFSDYQMQRLLKRRKVQECFEETEKEMGDVGMSLNDLESLLNEEGIETKIESFPTRRIASDNTTRILMINNVKQALAEAKQRQEAAETQALPRSGNDDHIKKDELEENLEKAIKMSLECNDSSACTSKDDSWTSNIEESEYSESEDDDGFTQPDMSCAKAYILQYTDLTHKTIDKMVARKTKSVKRKSKLPNVDQIIEDLKNEKSVIIDNVDLSSSDDDCVLEISDKISKAESNDFKSTNDDLEISSHVDSTQASVVCIENPLPDIITLDTSTESPQEVEDKHRPGSIPIKQEDSDSSEGEFEEVPEVESDIQNRPVIELNLNMVAPDPNDDIFADVFVNERMETICNKSLAEKNKLPEVKKDQNNKSGNSSICVTSLDIQRSIKNLTPEKPNFDYDFAVPSTSGVKITKCDILEKPKESTVELPKSEVFQDLDDDLERAIQMSLECIDHVEPSLNTSNTCINNQREIDTSPSTNTSNNDAKSAIELSHTETEQSTSTNPKSSAAVMLNDATVPRKPISTEELNSMADQIQTEEQDLLQEKGRLDRIGRNITEQMTKEAQELLQIFGIPYIIAPMEAEAQCAFLESVNLTDGTITDDSDIWLFGGRTVYKNFFNQKKHVLQFLAERIERSFNLTREQLVLLALLVGSDYTTGVTGVGPVTALEILASFPFNKKQFLNEATKQARYEKIVAGLQEFKKWIKAGRRTDNVTLKKKLKNVDLTDDFPSVRVVQAYLEPNVEKSDEKFTWGEIDITILRDYAKAKFGWSQNKLDEIVMPVLKRIQDRKSQRSVQDYFKRKIEFQSLEDQMSKRVKAAVQKMGPEESLAEVVEEAKRDDISKPTRKRKVTKKKINLTKDTNELDPTVPKLKKTEETDVLKIQGVTVVSEVQDGKSSVEINVVKTDRFQEIIPQREKDKQSLLQNKLKAIEIFRKTKLDKKRKPLKRRANLPKEKAELSESSDSN